MHTVVIIVGTVSAWASEFQRALVRGRGIERSLAANRLLFVSRFRVIYYSTALPAK